MIVVEKVEVTIMKTNKLCTFWKIEVEISALVSFWVPFAPASCIVVCPMDNTSLGEEIEKDITKT